MDDRHRRARRRSWWGLKGRAKRLLAMRIPHALLRALVRLRPSLREDGRLPAPARLDEVEGEAAGVRFTMLSPDRCIVAKELYWGRGRRPGAEDQQAIEMFAAAAVRSDVAIDIGAYTGLFTIAAARANPALRVHAFEVVPENYRALFDNCVRNDILDRVTLHHVGVGKPGGRVRVPNRISDSALPDFYSSRDRHDSGTVVRLVALDSLADRLPRGCRVIAKLDVEGAETDVLEHGQRLLAEFRPPILCEVLPDADAAALELLLKAHGYRFNVVREHDLQPRLGIDPDPDFRDWLFLPEDGERGLAALGLPVPLRSRRPALAPQ